MKKLSVIIASLLFFAGMTFAQQNQKSNQPSVNKQGASSSTTGASAGTPGSSGVKKVPAPTKGKAVPATKATTTTPPATGTTGK